MARKRLFLRSNTKSYIRNRKRKNTKNTMREMPPQHSGEDFERLSKNVFGRRPVLPRILERFGSMSIRDYVTNAVAHAGDHVPAERKHPVIHAIQTEATRLYGKTVGEQAAQQIEKYYAISTADHHGPIVHPSFTSADAALALPAATLPGYTNAIIFAGAVSMINPSFPGGFLLTKNFAHPPEKLPLFPARKRALSVFGCSGYRQEHLSRVQGRVRAMAAHGIIPEAAAQRATHVIHQTFGHEDLPTMDWYDDQVSIANRNFFNVLFADKPVDRPGLVYLSSERMLKRIMVDHHLKEKTLVHRILFDPVVRAAARRAFDGTFGGFTIAERKGTFFFWGAYATKGVKKIVPLWEENGFLRSEDGILAIALEPDAIGAALERDEIRLSTLMDLLVWSLFHGLACFGGTQQINYLTDMRQRYLQMLTEIPDASSADRQVADTVAPDLLIPYRLAFLKNTEGQYRPAGGLDIAAFGGADAWAAVCTTAENLTMGDAIATHIPELDCVIRHGVWGETDDVAVKLDDVIAMRNLADRIQPVGTLAA